jgi:hypothetical protein
MSQRGVHLTRTDENVREIDALAASVGGRVDLEELLGALPLQARRAAAGRLLGRAVAEAYTWGARDNRDRQWWPQGISTSADADPGELVAGRRLVVVSWYSHPVEGGSHGSRVTFLDLDTLRYEHVLLVVPVVEADGALTLRPLTVHAGGLVWAGGYLHVAATSRGIVSCRIDDLVRAGGDLPAYGHDWLLPVRFKYRAETPDGQAGLRYSFLSLDRERRPHSLVTGEYGRGSASTRLARFDLDVESGLLVAGDDGAATPVALDDGGVVQMQGAVVARGRHHVTVSRGPWWPGDVYVGAPGSLQRRRLAVPMGPEDLTYWPSTDRLWSVSEHPRRRWIFSMRRSWFD